MSAAAPIASQLAYCRAARRLRSRCAQRPAELYQGLRRLSEQADRGPRSQPQPAVAPVAEVRVAEARAAEVRPVDLSASSDADRPADRRSHLERVMHLTPAAMVFIPIVRESLDGPILRYSARQHLIRTADQLGIARFQANLLIALVQHEMQKRNPVDVGGAISQPEPGSSLARFVPLAVLLAMECAGILSLWRALHA